MNQFAPNFKRSVIARQVLSPVDLEQRFGLTGGNIMQGVMSLSSLSFMRPVPGYADYRTPVRGPLPVRGGDASGRRRDGRVRLQRGAGDRAGPASVGEAPRGAGGARAGRCRALGGWDRAGAGVRPDAPSASPAGPGHVARPGCSAVGLGSRAGAGAG